jgi:hypothetical protein
MITDTKFYLILHKVRGEGAFDIAIKLDTPLDEEVWIIPTSGHRAYPYWREELTDTLGGSFTDGWLDHLWRNPPPDLRDHYATFAEPTAPREAGVRKQTPATPELDDL